MMNLPNILTMLRIMMALGFLALFHRWIAVSALLFVLAAGTDFFDGYLARKQGLVTAFGKIMDPIADKFLILSAFWIFSSVGMVPWWMFTVIAVREIGVTVFRFWAMARGRVLAAEKAGKAKTVLQISAVCFLLAFRMLVLPRGGAFDEAPLSLFLGAGTVALLWLSVIITLLSGIAVVWNNRKMFIS